MSPMVTGSPSCRAANSCRPIRAAAVAAATYQQALAAVALARLNLAKTVIRAPASGYVTNLRLRVGEDRREIRVPVCATQRSS